MSVEHGSSHGESFTDIIVSLLMAVLLIPEILEIGEESTEIFAPASAGGGHH
jgi:hypothetical protein